MRLNFFLGTCLSVVLACFAAPALADSAATANAAMDALGRGDNAAAVNLFSQVIAAGDLSREDQESAYFERGQAYMNMGALDRAVGDFRAALKLKPDDDAAMNGLQQALTAQAQNQARAEAAQAQAAQQAEPPAPPPPPPLSAAVLDGVWEFHLCGEMARGIGNVTFSNVSGTSATMSGGVRTSPLDMQVFKRATIDGLDLKLEGWNGIIRMAYYGAITSPTHIQSRSRNCNWYAEKQ